MRVGDFGEAGIGHCDDAGVGGRWCRRVVGGLAPWPEVRALKIVDFPTLGEANDSAVQWHCVLVPCYEACCGGREVSLTG